MSWMAGSSHSLGDAPVEAGSSRKKGGAMKVCVAEMNDLLCCTDPVMSRMYRGVVVAFCSPVVLLYFVLCHRLGPPTPAAQTVGWLRAAMQAGLNSSTSPFGTFDSDSGFSYDSSASYFNSLYS